MRALASSFDFPVHVDFVSARLSLTSHGCGTQQADTNVSPPGVVQLLGPGGYLRSAAVRLRDAPAGIGFEDAREYFAFLKMYVHVQAYLYVNVHAHVHVLACMCGRLVPARRGLTSAAQDPCFQ